MTSSIDPDNTHKGARVVAIDWSGRRGADQKRVIWLGEAIDGELVRLERGRTRTEVVDWLIAEAARDPNLVVGIDCAFSLPAWYLRDRGLTAKKLWAALADEALTPTMKQLGLGQWMNTPEPPFWIKRKADAGLTRAQEFRQTDHDARAEGAQAKSVFQLVGAGQVGRGSLYGMQALHRLSDAGFRIWPFDAPGMPLVVEMYPRLLTGPVTKSNQTERELYLAAVPIAARFREQAATREDAFDTVLSAIGMAAAVNELTALPDEPGYALEGKIWPSNMRAVGTVAIRAQPTSSVQSDSVARRIISEKEALGPSPETPPNQRVTERPGRTEELLPAAISRADSVEAPRDRAHRTTGPKHARHARRSFVARLFRRGR